MLSGKARLAGVMGWPVSHSRSPLLHGHWLERYRIDGAYVPLPVPPGRIETALRALPVLGFRGVNVTVPHKEAALEMCDELDPLARRIGAVNTVVVGEDDRLIGSNTDAYGFIENLRRNSGWRTGPAPVVVLGAGGAARAVCVALLDAGAASLTIVNRTRLRADFLADELGAGVDAVDWDQRHATLEGAMLLVNTTSLGMTGQPALNVDLAALPADAIVCDIVYAPLETPLLAAARARGNPVVDGLGMLLYQAQPGFEAWFGVRPEVDQALRRVMLEDLAG
ncbi:MAG: shikimate dehydrogenase [Rhodospirillales bacterium]|nr:MAG: shikimate dehydrogenase [Rhodospirillales bacterium]